MSLVALIRRIVPYGLSSYDVTLMSSGATQALFVTGPNQDLIIVQNSKTPSTNLLALKLCVVTLDLKITRLI